MTKRVQLIGHPAEEANAFIGLDRELTVDDTNHDLRLHDGASPGGHTILNQDECDNRYQQRSVELDGLTGWEPNERGILARQGPTNYNLIEIQVDSDQLTITNPGGFGGNPFISLVGAIQTSHVWVATQVFQSGITVSGGQIQGNLTGDSAGVHTGNVIGHVQGNVTGNANGDHTGTFTGTGVFTEITLPAGSVGVGNLDSGLLDDLNALSTFPGMVTMYSGEIADIPPNWALCDGSNGTPDLRDRFIICAGTTYLEDSAGGTTSHTHVNTIDSSGAHTHSGTAAGTSLTVDQMPAHRHANGITDSGPGDVFSRGTTAAAMTTPDSVDNNGNSGTVEGWSETVGLGDPHGHTVTADSSGAHVHTSSMTTVSHIPPFYALAFVMRIS